MTKKEAYETVVSFIGQSRTIEGISAYQAFYTITHPEPDPDTGLLPCGCGGAADVADDLASGGHFVCCSGCGTMTGFWSTRDIARDAWNRAMGLKES